MGRPSLGKAAKDVVVATKVTIAERDALVDKYGNVYRGVKHGVNLALSGGVPRAEAAPDPLSRGQMGKAHRHRRGEKQESTWEAGQEVKHYLCAEEDCDVML